MSRITDTYGRAFKSLRISLLNSCNFACTYCTDGKAQDTPLNHHATKQSTNAFLQQIQALHEQLQLEDVRLTGGEPLLHPQLLEIVAGIKALGIKKIKLTTNGFLLSNKIEALKNAGVTDINISLDAIDEDVFFLMTKRKNVSRVLKAIDDAIQCGINVKLNAVIMRGINEQEILPLLTYAFDRNIIIRFLEVMAMGHLHTQIDKYLFTQAAMLRVIESAHSIVALKREKSATANYWQTTTGKEFGIIANESTPFCNDCDRLRLDSNGNIYGCLSSNTPLSMQGINTDETLSHLLEKALAQKQPAKFIGSRLSMLDIGG
jgi:GTP 3',8-cyclase